MRVGNSTVLRTAAAWLLCLMLAVAAAVVTIVIVNAKVYSPQHQVRAYFDALQDGDGAKALGLLRAKVPNANAALLDGAPLKQSVADISDLEVGDPVQLDGDRVEVPATTRLRGRPTRRRSNWRSPAQAGCSSTDGGSFQRSCPRSRSAWSTKTRHR